MLFRILWLISITSIAQAVNSEQLSVNNEQLSIDTEQIYDISQDLGQTVGNNLFYSFDSFNLYQGEIAQFSGSDSIHNIIARVIGGEPSFINGTIRSTIPNADFYFLNPHGIVFGESAQLDLQGSFHASTADYVKLSDGGKFHARFPEQDILTTASIESFGFLNQTAASIEVTNAQLAVAPTQTLALIGGDIHLTSTVPMTYDESSQHQLTHQLVAPSGQIIIDSKGDIQLNNFGVDTSGLFGGQMTIRGKDLTLNDSVISSHTFAEMPGQTIDIQVDNLTLHDSDILANTYTVGKGSNINLHVNDLIGMRVDRSLGIEFGATIRGGSHISTLTVGEGNSGDIDIQAKNINLNQSDIGTTTFATGKSGDVGLQVTDTLQAIDSLSLANVDTVPAVAGIFTLTAGEGNSGNIDISVGNVALDKGATIGITSVALGQGGSITVQADSIKLTGQETLFGIPSSISGISMGSARTSPLTINARHIQLIDGGVITTNTFFSGGANMLTVNVSDTLFISGVAQVPYQMLGFPAFPYPSNITSASANPVDNGGQASDLFVRAKHIILEAGGTIGSMTYGSGDAGHTKIEADSIHMSGWQNNGILYRSGINNSSFNTESYAGCAGQITMSANKITIQDGGAINASTMNAGGGNIELNISDALYLFNQGSITTSVQSGNCDSGNISINTPQFLVMNHSPIIAQADVGQGGNINIAAQQFLKSTNSLVSASSRLGIDGNVQINSPTENVSSGLLHLYRDFMQEVQIRDNCKASRAGKLPTKFKSTLSLQVDLYHFPNYFIEDYIPSDVYFNTTYY